MIHSLPPALVLLHAGCAALYAGLASLILMRQRPSRTGLWLAGACLVTAAWAASVALTATHNPIGGIAGWLETSSSARVEDGWTREELETHLREEYSTFTWLLEPMIERAGFEIVASDYGSVGAYASFVCEKRG